MGNVVVLSCSWCCVDIFCLTANCSTPCAAGKAVGSCGLVKHLVNILKFKPLQDRLGEPVRKSSLGLTLIMQFYNVYTMNYNYLQKETVEQITLWVIMRVNNSCTSSAAPRIIQ